MDGQVVTVGVNPLALVILIVLGALTWRLPRRFAVCPLPLMICLMPTGQVIELFGLHFYFYRLLLLVGAVRVVAKGEAAGLRLTRIDKVFLWWVIVSIIFGSLSKPSLQLLINRLGSAFDAFACFFFVRSVIGDTEDLVISVRAFAWAFVPLAVLMLVENGTAHNPFSIFGGVPDMPDVRHGRFRCQGPFEHAILAGSFAAAQLPLFVALYFYKSDYRRLAVAGVLCSFTVVLISVSSGAVLGLVAAAGGLAFWPFRRYTRELRRAAVLSILGLALLMKAPVWYIFARASGVFGGTGWHRSYLIDQAVTHLDEWWLFGTTVTAHWGGAISADPNMMDITNQYVMEGVRGGLLTLLLFLMSIVQCFKAIGRQLHMLDGLDLGRRLLIWCLGVSLFTHCILFLSIPYFDQTCLVWYWLLASISGVAGDAQAYQVRATGEVGIEPVQG